MEKRRNTKADPEQYFLVVKNSYSTASLAAGQAVAWDYTTDHDGVGVTKPPAATVCGGMSFAGIVAETIASDAYGLIQVYGYNSAARVRCTSGGKVISAGSPLILDDYAAFALTTMELSGGSEIRFPVGFAMESYATRTSTTKKIFIKSL